MTVQCKEKVYQITDIAEVISVVPRAMGNLNILQMELLDCFSKKCASNVLYVIVALCDIIFLNI